MSCQKVIDKVAARAAANEKRRQHIQAYTANRAAAAEAKKKAKEEAQAVIKANHAAQAAARAAKNKAIQEAKAVEAKKAEEAKMAAAKLYTEKIYASITDGKYYFSGKHMDYCHLTYTLAEQNGEVWFVKRRWGQRSWADCAFDGRNIYPNELEIIINTERCERGLPPLPHHQYYIHPIAEKKLIRPAPISPLVAANTALKEQIAQLNNRINELQRAQNGGGDMAQLLQQLNTLNALLSR